MICMNVFCQVLTGETTTQNIKQSQLFKVGLRSLFRMELK